MAQDDSISTDAPMQQSASDEDMREDMRLGMSLNDIHMSISRAFHTMNNTTRPCARSLGLGQGQPRILSYIAVHGVSTQREITEKGRHALAAWEDECRRVDRIMFRGFTSEEEATLRDMLERVRKNMADELEAGKKHE